MVQLVEDFFAVKASFYFFLFALFLRIRIISSYSQSTAPFLRKARALIQLHQGPVSVLGKYVKKTPSVLVRSFSLSASIWFLLYSDPTVPWSMVRFRFQGSRLISMSDRWIYFLVLVVDLLTVPVWADLTWGFVQKFTR